MIFYWLKSYDRIKSPFQLATQRNSQYFCNYNGYLTGEHIADGGKVDRWNGVVMLIEMKGKGLERIWFLNINIYYLDCETEDSIKVTEEQKGTERSD